MIETFKDGIFNLNTYHIFPFEGKNGTFLAFIVNQMDI